MAAPAKDGFDTEEAKLIILEAMNRILPAVRSDPFVFLTNRRRHASGRVLPN